MMKSGTLKPVASVIDIFCGAGGLSHGFFLEDFLISCGIDADEGCKYAFEHNNDAPFVRRDIVDVDPEKLSEEFTPCIPKRGSGLKVLKSSVIFFFKSILLSFSLVSQDGP